MSKINEKLLDIIECFNELDNEIDMQFGLFLAEVRDACNNFLDDIEDFLNREDVILTDEGRVTFDSLKKFVQERIEETQYRMFEWDSPGSDFEDHVHSGETLLIETINVNVNIPVEVLKEYDNGIDSLTEHIQFLLRDIDDITVECKFNK